MTQKPESKPYSPGADFAHTKLKDILSLGKKAATLEEVIFYYVQYGILEGMNRAIDEFKTRKGVELSMQEEVPGILDGMIGGMVCSSSIALELYMKPEHLMENGIRFSMKFSEGLGTLLAQTILSNTPPAKLHS